MKHVVSYSGGIASWATAVRVLETVEPADVRLVFCDTHMEDEDLYRFLDETVAALGVELTRIEDGRTPWQVFADEKLIGNTQRDVCSRILKRDLFKRWLTETYTPDEAVLYLGIDWTESHRGIAAARNYAPYPVAFPLCVAPYRTKDEWMTECRAGGIEPPRLYALGMPHNNCGGFCVKAGHAQFIKLLETMPDRYRWHEAQEDALREAWGKNVAVLRDRRGGRTRPLPLKMLREWHERQQTLWDHEDWGGCGCFVE